MATTKKAPEKSTKKTSEKKAVPTKKAALKNPKGGLTAAGRKAFAEKEGSHLRPGVQGAADTPDKMKRKGSFLRRHFANPRGPMERDGEPTRLALSAQAWGEPLLKTEADAKQLAEKGSKLLEQFHAATDKKTVKTVKPKSMQTTASVDEKAEKTAAKKVTKKAAQAKTGKNSDAK